MKPNLKKIFLMSKLFFIFLPILFFSFNSLVPLAEAAPCTYTNGPYTFGACANPPYTSGNVTATDYITDPDSDAIVDCENWTDYDSSACAPKVVNGGWTAWGACSVSGACGQTGTQKRACTNPTPSPNGADCSALDGGNDSKSCSTEACIDSLNCSGSLELSPTTSSTNPFSGTLTWETLNCANVIVNGVATSKATGTKPVTASFGTNPQGGEIVSFQLTGEPKPGCASPCVTLIRNVTASYVAPPPPATVNVSACAEGGTWVISPGDYREATNSVPPGTYGIAYTPPVNYTVANIFPASSQEVLSGNAITFAATCSLIKRTVIGTATSTNGTISPLTQSIDHGSTASLIVDPKAGYSASVSGCGGSPSSGAAQFTYTTSAITADCTVTASFTLLSVTTYTVAGSATSNGTIGSAPLSRTISLGSTTSFIVTPNTGFTASVGGTCGGALVGTNYTTNAIIKDCTVIASFTLVSSNVDGGWTVSPLTCPTVCGTAGGTITRSCTNPIPAGTGANCNNLDADGSLTSKSCAATQACATVMSGTLTPGPTTSCTIASGGKSCTIALTRTVNNPIVVNGSAVTSPTGTPSPSNGDSGTVTFTVPYNALGVNFFLYNNGVEPPLAQTKVATNCISGTTWNGTLCTAGVQVACTAPVITFDVTPVSGPAGTIEPKLTWFATSCE